MSEAAAEPNRDTSRISPTAHYTSYVWYRHGMSDAALATRLGHVLFRTLQPWNSAYQRFARRPNLEMNLLARHRVIDHLLARAIESGRVRQVVEIAAGLSPRGFRVARRYRAEGVLYVEGDLPEMAAHKRRLLDDAGLRGTNHQVVELNALADDGPDSLRGVAGRLLDPTLGTAIVTEGLLGYFDEPTVRGMWARFARALQPYPARVYLADLTVAEDVDRGGRAFRSMLELFARGKVFIHFADAPAALAALREAGFAKPALHQPADFGALDLTDRGGSYAVRVLEAS